MIHEMKSELERILHYTQVILQSQNTSEEVAAAARQAERSVLKLLGRGRPKVCPECGHLFRGKGWDGIDVHWRAKHESIMPYTQAWPLIQAGTYQSPRESPRTDLFTDV